MASREVIIALVIFVVAATIILMLAFDVISIGGAGLSEEACKATVFGSTIKIKPTVLGYSHKFWDLDFNAKCPVNRIHVQEKKIEQTHGDQSDGYNELNGDDLMSEIIYNELARCWNQFGTAAQAIDDVEFDGRGTKLDEPMCITCGIVTVDRDIDDIVIADAYNYGDIKTYSGQQKYSQYLTSNKNEISSFTPEGESLTIKSGSRYYIVYSISRMSERKWGIGIPGGQTTDLPDDQLGLAGCNSFTQTGLDVDTSQQSGDAEQFRRKIGCGYDNQISFGKVVGGSTSKTPPFSYDNVYPMTVRVIPEENLFSEVVNGRPQCSRLV